MPLLKLFAICILLPIMCFLASCHYQLVSAQTEYITRQSLASYHIGTPDPNLNHPVLGQRLIVRWTLPETFKKYNDLHLEIVIRLHDHSERTLIVPICDFIYTYIYVLSKEEFCATEGIATYKIDLVGNGCILYKWRHQLWVNKIEIKSE